MLAAWVAALIAVSAGSMSIGSRFSNDLSLPGTDSNRAAALLKARFPAAAGDTDQIVFRARRGTLADLRTHAAIAAALRRIAHLHHVVAVASPFGAGTIAPDGRIGYATVTFDRQAGDLPTAAVSRVIADARAIGSARLQVELGGQAIEQTEKPSLGAATAVGLAAAAIAVLLVSFGSFLAMGLPIVTALFGLGTGLGLIAFASHGIGMAFFVPQLAAMIGLGVGIDYALFIVTRYRDAYRTNGGDVAASVETAMDTAGRAVLFAGITVVIALLGMFALGVSFLYSVGIAGSLAVLLMLAASATLLPVLLTVAGHRLGRVRRGRAQAGSSPFLASFVGAIQRHPWPTAIAATSLMLVLAAPVASMRLGLSDAGTDPAPTTTHRAFALLAQGFGPGSNGPLQVAVRLPRPGASATVTRLAAAIGRTPDVVAVGAPRLNRAGTAAVLTVVPASAPQDAATSALVRRLRSQVIPVYIGGWSATAIDFSHVLATKLWLFVGVVVVLSALLLLIVFRSLVIPVQAAMMNLLSIGAAMGIATAVFQRGWLSGTLHTQPGPIDAYVPVVVFAIVFGLSMDYQVFLVSRIHEEWRRTGESSESVRTGIVSSGRVVTAAAAVMIVVFPSFVAGHDRRLELFGVSLASAVFLDAVVIRMILLPAVLEIAGRSAWAFPRWLDRRLPRVAIEAELSPSSLL